MGMINCLQAADSLGLHPGKHNDGGGLYLQVSRGGGCSWLFSYTLNGKTHQMGLGSLRDISFAEARQMREAYHRLVRSGVDPREQHKRDIWAEEAARCDIVKGALGGQVMRHTALGHYIRVLGRWISRYFGDGLPPVASVAAFNARYRKQHQIDSNYFELRRVMYTTEIRGVRKAELPEVITIAETKRRGRVELADWAVRDSFRRSLRAKSIPQSLVSAKRMHIRVTRLLKEK